MAWESLPIGQKSVEGICRLLDNRYETASLALAANLYPGIMDKIMPSSIAASMVDRLLHQFHMITTIGESV